MFGSIINYLTRSTLSVAAPALMQDLHISTQQYSWIVCAFQGAIMLQPFCGYVLDVIGLKRGFALFAVAWSLISILSTASVSSPPRLIAVHCKSIHSIVFKRGQDDHCEILSCSDTSINDRSHASAYGTGKNRGASGDARSQTS
jgi:hypothetical protein